MDKQPINLNRKLFDKSKYEKVINTDFTQLVKTTPIVEVDPIPTVDEFFKYYNDLFFSIPQTGDLNSHEYLIKTSSEYINSDQINEEIKALIDEITELRQENVELNQELLKRLK